MFVQRQHHKSAMAETTYQQPSTGRKAWNFTKYFFPYFFLISGLALVIGGMADVGYVPSSLPCNDWKEANHEYTKIRDISGETDPRYPDLSLFRFSNACGLWKTWFTFAIITTILYAVILMWPMAFTVGRRFMFISLNTIVISAVISSLLTFIFVIVFFGVAGAWKYDWKCNQSGGNTPTCAFFTGGMPYPTPPSPDILPWQNASEPFRNILSDPKFFARYASVRSPAAAPECADAADTGHTCRIGVGRPGAACCL
jgi:hypothetical protein